MDYLGRDAIHADWIKNCLQSDSKPEFLRFKLNSQKFYSNSLLQKNIISWADTHCWCDF